MTQRFVPGAGRSAIVSGLPSGPMTYLALGRRGSVMNLLTHSTCNGREIYLSRLKICLNGTLQSDHCRRIGAARLARHGPKSFEFLTRARPCSRLRLGNICHSKGLTKAAASI